MLWFTKSRRAQNVDDYETWIEGGVMPTLNAFDNGDVRTTVIVIPIHDKATRFAGKRQMHDGTYSMDGAGNGLGIGKEGDPMNTLTGGDRHAVFETSNVRRLTPVECERLQGFPDDWTAGQSDSTRYKQMGNAVAVPVVEWIIQNIVDVAEVS
jgi:DNA (cytosine-5)-methyltransferase 1